MSIIQEIKERTDLIELIAETYTPTERGRVRTTKEHDSLKIWVDTQTWYWFSQDVGGDCLDWIQHRDRCDLAAAIEYLADRAGIERRPLTQEEQAQRAERQQHHQILALAAQYHHRLLRHHPAAQPARAYCAARGWNQATIEREMIGCTLPQRPADNKALSDEQPLSRILQDQDLIHHPTAKAVLSIPADTLIYTHRHRGRVVYLSGRGIEAKRHYNLPEDLAGPKQPYRNHPAPGNGPAARLLVEGQADAISLGQLGIDAIALCGLHGADVDASHVAFDADPNAQDKALDVALAIDPLTRLANPGRLATEGPFTGPIGDWNDALIDDATTDDVVYLLENAPTAIETLARTTARSRGDQRTERQRRLLDAYLSLDDLTAADLKPQLADALGVGIAQFRRLLKARQTEQEASGEKENPDRYEYSAGDAIGGYIWEQCIQFRPNQPPFASFAVRHPDGTIQQQASVDINGVTYLPHPPDIDIIKSRVIHFPSQAADYGSQKQLLQQIQQFIHDYLDIDPFYERLAAYYVLFSWVYDLFENLPYLRALGDYGTGKTRYLQAIGILCYRPMFVSGASSVSPIFRLIDIFRGTLIIDEADFANSDAEAEIIKILNVGYYRDGVVLRSEKDPASAVEEWMPKAYRVYGPKILATRRPFTDRATESRCLTKRMSSARPRADIPYILDQDFWKRATALRNQLLRYRLEHWQPVAVDPGLADDSVEPRLNQITMALKTLVSDDMRHEIDKFIRAYNDTLIADRQMSLPALVVQALVDIHHNGGTDLMGNDTRDFTMKGITQKVRELALEFDPDIKVHPRSVSKILSEDLGLPRRSQCPRTRRSRLDYTDDELTALMQRYGIEPPADELTA